MLLTVCLLCISRSQKLKKQYFWNNFTYIIEQNERKLLKERNAWKVHFIWLMLKFLENCCQNHSFWLWNKNSEHLNVQYSTISLKWISTLEHHFFCKSDLHVCNNFGQGIWSELRNWTFLLTQQELAITAMLRKKSWSWSFNLLDVNSYCNIQYVR